MRYTIPPKSAAKSKTVLLNTAVATVAVLALLQEHGAALHIPSDWMARIAFAGAVLTILLRRFSAPRPVRFRPHRRKPDSWDEPGEAPEVIDNDPLFV